MKTKIFAAFIIAMLLALVLSSCQLSKLFDKDTTSVEEETTTTAPIVDVEPIDFNTLEIEQYITLGKYKDIPLSITIPELTEEIFATAIDELLSRNGKYVEITDRAAVSGDVLNINFEGFMDGVQFEDGTADNQIVELSENSGYIDGFADGLIGALPGTTVTLNLTFPDNYEDSMAGKEVTFEIEVNYIRGELIVPELNVEFVQSYTEGEYTEVEAFLEYYRGVLIEEYRIEAKNEAYAELWEAIVNNADIIKYPEQQVQYNFSLQKQQYLSYAANYSMSYEEMLTYAGITEDDIMDSAKAYTKEELVLHSILKAEGITLEEEEYQSMVTKLAADVGVSKIELEIYYGSEYLSQMFIWDKVFEKLYLWADVTEINAN